MQSKIFLFKNTLDKNLKNGGLSMDEALQLINIIWGLSGEFGEFISLITTIIMAISVLVGALNCFFGYKLFRIINAAFGAIIGGIIGLVIGGIITQSTTGAAAFFLILGIIGGWLAYKLYLLGVFISCYFSGFLLTSMLALSSGAGSEAIALGIAGGIILGIIGLILTKHIIIIVTAINGAISMALVSFLFSSSLGVYYFLVAIFSLLGFFVQQHMNTRNKKDIDVPRVEKKQNFINHSDESIESCGAKAITPGKDDKDLDSDSYPDKKLIINSFPPEIVKEVAYLFPKNSIQLMKYVPYAIDEENWSCLCGGEASSHICRFCGTERIDALEKINYSYLNEHMLNRLKEEEIIRQNKIKEREEKIKAIIDKSKILADKSKVRAREILKIIKTRSGEIWVEYKPIIIRKKKEIIGVAVCILLLIIGINSPQGKSFYYTQKGKLAERKDYTVALQNYVLANEHVNKPKTRLNIINTYHNMGDYQSFTRELLRALEDFPNDKKLGNLKRKFTPELPQISLASGTYNDIQEISIESEDMAYYRYDGESYLYESPIRLDKNRTYNIIFYTMNEIGFTSEELENTYEIKLPIPKTVKANIAGGIFTEGIIVELLRADDLDIFYTLDGQEPSQASLRYRQPINIGFGITKLRAISYNEYGVGSDELEETYRISADKYGILSDINTGYSGYHYDYVIRSNTIFLCDKSDGSIVSQVKGNRPLMVQEYGDKLYFLDNGDIFTYDLYDNDLSKLASVNATRILLSDDLIYYTGGSASRLYSIDLEGKDNQLLIDFSINNFDKIETGLLLCAQDGIYQYGIDDGGLKKISGEIVQQALLADENKLYFLKDGEIWLVENGGSKKIFEKAHSNRHDYPRGMNNGFWSKTDSSYTGFMIFANKLYARRENKISWADISWLTNRDINQGFSTTYNWFILGKDGRQIDDIEADMLVPVDGGYLLPNENMKKVLLQ